MRIKEHFKITFTKTGEKKTFVDLDIFYQIVDRLKIEYKAEYDRADQLEDLYIASEKRVNDLEKLLYATNAELEAFIRRHYDTRRN